MSKLPDIIFDKTEIVMKYKTKNAVQSINLTYDQIKNIRINSSKEWRFLRRVPSEEIIITHSKNVTPIVYTKMKDKRYFESYKSGLRKFAKDNGITLYDNVK